MNNIYGVCISDIKKQNEEKILQFLKELHNEGYTDYLNSFQERVTEIDNYTIAEWLDDFEGQDGYFGLSAFLKEVINQKEDLTVVCDDPNGKQYLGIRPVVPWKYSEKTKMITEEEFQTIINHYIQKVCEDENLEIKLWSYHHLYF